MELNLHKAYQSVEGVKFIIDHHEFLCSAGKKFALNQKFITNPDKIKEELDTVDLFLHYRKDPEFLKILKKIKLQIHQVNEINYSLERLKGRVTLTDIDFFEIKRFAIIANQIYNLSKNLPNYKPQLEESSDIIKVLDPNNLNVADFYIYDEYSPEIAKLRKQLSEATDEEAKAKIYSEIVQLENSIREDLSRQLYEHHDTIKQNFEKVAYTDFVLAKSKYVLLNDFVRPVISDDKTVLESVYYPHLKHILNKQNKEVQPVSVKIENKPTLITGANMGGKTVLLKTVQLCQYLFQFGFFIPAKHAEIVPVETVISNFSDTQSIEKGLSSFGAELVTFDKVIKAIRKNKKVLILLDEPASTTNPIEGTALVNSIINLLDKYKAYSIVTTHFSGIVSNCIRLRVVGLNTDGKEPQDCSVADLNKFMDYSLIKDDGDTPLDAINIAEILKIDEELIKKAKQHIKTKD
ncbi:MAG: hypothetical protein PHP31_08455 [Lentimicrobiaceae bacterium]|nr:hypothetical protein [Lentimicrobiaceae bacterium]